MARKQKKPALPAVDEVRAPHEVAGARRARGTLLSFAVAAFCALSVGAFQPGFELAYGAAIVLFSLGMAQAEGHRYRARLAAGRALLDAELWEPAVVELKELTGRRATADEAAYFVALAYDRQGARKLALGSYQHYLERHPGGLWAVEARVRKEELEAAGPQVATREVAVRVNCPFCKSEITDVSPIVECAACGTAHHAGCYEEQSGCAVYGCESKTARARVAASG